MDQFVHLSLCPGVCGYLGGAAAKCNNNLVSAGVGLQQLEARRAGLDLLKKHFVDRPGIKNGFWVLTGCAGACRNLKSHMEICSPVVDQFVHLSGVSSYTCREQVVHLSWISSYTCLGSVRTPAADQFVQLSWVSSHTCLGSVCTPVQKWFTTPRAIIWKTISTLLNENDNRSHK